MEVGRLNLLLEKSKQIDSGQVGFTPKRGTLQNIYPAQSLLRRVNQEKKPAVLVFVDLKKAYDSVPRQDL